MEQIKTPEEIKSDRIEYVIKKYLDKKNLLRLKYRADKA